MTEPSIDIRRGTYMVRCKNWEDEPDVCHLDCGVPVTLGEWEDGDWIDIILDSNPEWFVMLRSCPEHGRHVDPYCSITCFERLHNRHEHPHRG